MEQRLRLISLTTIFSARVNQASFTYPLTQVTFDGVTTGAFGDVLPGMTVLFGSTAGADDYGRQRIRAAATSTVLNIGRSSQGDKDGEVNLTDNAYITVLDDFRVWAKIPYIDENGVIYKDEIAYTDETENIPPKANITGGWRAATITSGTNVATFQFVGTASYAVAAGATISTYLWDVDDGTITVGTSASNTITATFPAGKRWVSLRVTDSNGKTHTMRVMVISSPLNHSDSTAFQCVDHRITQQGQTCSFRILEDVPESGYPDGMAVIFWEGEPASASDYSNVKFWGWHQTDSNNVAASKTATLRDATLNCLDIAGRLNTLPGFPQSVERHTAADDWLKMVGLNMDRYIDFLFRWHSTAFENTYYTPSGTGDDYAMLVIGSDGASLWAQCQERAKALVPDYVLTCNRNGMLRVLVDPFLQDTGDRTATSQETVNSSKWTAVNWEHTRPPTIHWLWGEAIKASASTISALFCTAPGKTPGQGEAEQTSGEQLAIDQDGLNSCEGHRYARANTDTGLVPVLMTDDYGIEPADMTWVTLDVSGDNAARRGLGFLSARGLPLELGISYDYARTGTIKRVEMIWEHETSGYPAVTYTPPDTDWDWEPPDPIEPSPPSTQGGGFGTNYFQINNYLARTRDLSAASPAWTNITGTITGTIYDFILDPHDPANNAYASSSTGFWKSTTMADASPTWVQIRTAAQIAAGYSATTYNGARKISASINSNGFVAFWHTITSGGFQLARCTITTDGGTSWSYNNLHSSASVRNFSGAADYLPHLVGGEIVLGACFDLGSGVISFSQSTDSGASWAVVSIVDNLSASSNQCLTLHYPFHDNEDGQIIWIIFAGGGGANENGLWRSTNGGTSWTKINTGETGVKRHGVESHTGNRNRLFHWREDNTLWLSINGGSSWSQANATGVSGTVRAAGGFPYNNEQYYVLTTDGVFVSTDNGDTFADKSGDWSNGFACDVGSGAVVPLWTE